jgi:hypothetical protein
MPRSQGLIPRLQQYYATPEILYTDNLGYILNGYLMEINDENNIIGYDGRI